MIALVAGLSLGTEFYSLRRLLYLTDIDKMILFNIRGPRVLAAFIIGAGLSITGAVLQAILKNPLAESYTLGISGGASLGIAMGVILGKTALTPYFAFFGALISVFIVILSSIKKRFSTPRILLGVALNFLFSSLVLFIVTVVKTNNFRQRCYASSEYIILSHKSVIWVPYHYNGYIPLSYTIREGI